MLHYLIVWGRAVDGVRAGTGVDKISAAQMAFGDYNQKMMTFKQVTLSELRSGRKRLPLIRQLLLDHARRLQDNTITACVRKELASNVYLRVTK